MNPSLVITSLVCHAHVSMAASCLGSICRESRDPVRFRVHDDGTLSERDRQILAESLPGVEIILSTEAEQRMGSELARHPYCGAFRKKSPLARKLFDVPLLAGERFCYCDADVWWFRPFNGLGAEPTGGVRIVFMEDSQQAYSLRPWHLLPHTKLKMPSRINTGLISARKDVLDLDFVEWLLSRQWRAFNKFPLWLEQTCWAAIGQRAGCAIYDPERVRVIIRTSCLARDLVAGHFTSSVRSLMPRDVSTDQTRAAVNLEWVKPAQLSAGQLACEQGGRLLKRRLAAFRSFST